MGFVLHFTAQRVENGEVRPSDRAANLRRANVNAGSSRRARRRTLFAPTAGRRPEPDLDLDCDPAPVAVDGPIVAGEPAEMNDLALEEFVIDDDDYPEVSAAQRRVERTQSEPDRVDDIDEWLEEFAVSDYFDAMPH